MHTIGGAVREDSAGDSSVSGLSPLDPTSWDELAELGRRMVDDMTEHVRTIRHRPVWRVVPTDVRERLRRPLPAEGIGPDEAYEEFLRDVLPYPTGNLHPRFWGWVLGSGTPLGALAEYLAATMNPNVSGLGGAAPLVEAQVIEWLCELFGYPKDASGLFVSGGSMANVLGLAVGLSERGGVDIVRDGVVGATRRPIVYLSREAHYSLDKAVRLLGLGSSSIRVVATDGAHRLDGDALRRAIAADRAAGHHPFAVVGTAGTTNTGAFDDLVALADVATHEGMWFHVDAAFGAFVALVPALRQLVRGLDRADSLAFDLHKWLLAPVETGALLVRDAAAHRRTFAAEADYLVPMPGGIGRPDVLYADFGPQLTRGFRALKVWLTLKAYGIAPFAEVVRRNVEQAAHLATLVRAHPELELLAPVPSNVVCYRYCTPGGESQELNDLNRTLVVRLQEDGIAAPSHTLLDGRFAIRVCITNHRTTLEDTELLVRETVRLGRELAA